MSEQATETVVVHDANTARALIGRSIWGVQITDQMGDDGSFALLSDDTPLATGTYGDPHGVEVDALPPVTEWVHLDDLPGRTLPSGSVVECIEYHGHMGDHARWRWSNEHVGNSARFIPLTVVDHMVEVLAETPPPEPDTVSVRGAAEALIQTYSPLDFTEPRIEKVWADLVAALAAEGGEG